MEVYRNPYGPHADRIDSVLDHVFGSSPHLSSRERSRSLLQLLVEGFDKMTQMRKAKNLQLTVSDNGSSSPNDPSNFANTPEDGQPWTPWQPETSYGQAYPHSLPPVTTDGWWPNPIQPGMLCGPAIPEHDEYGIPQHDEYGYPMGSGAP